MRTPPPDTSQGDGRRHLGYDGSPRRRGVIYNKDPSSKFGVAVPQPGTNF